MTIALALILCAPVVADEPQAVLPQGTELLTEALGVKWLGDDKEVSGLALARRLHQQWPDAGSGGEISVSDLTLGKGPLEGQVVDLKLRLAHGVVHGFEITYPEQRDDNDPIDPEEAQRQQPQDYTDEQCKKVCSLVCELLGGPPQAMPKPSGWQRVEGSGLASGLEAKLSPSGRRHLAMKVAWSPHGSSMSPPQAYERLKAAQVLKQLGGPDIRLGAPWLQAIESAFRLPVDERNIGLKIVTGYTVDDRLGFGPLVASTLLTVSREKYSRLLRVPDMAIDLRVSFCGDEATNRRVLDAVIKRLREWKGGQLQETKPDGQDPIFTKYGSWETPTVREPRGDGSTMKHAQTVSVYSSKIDKRILPYGTLYSVAWSGYVQHD
ncbi:MAG: hypothetical protein JXL80_03590 [Planctomycetes bacterium]|nr:hypothetical protein [Planctomycetota bacterium]